MIVPHDGIWDLPVCCQELADSSDKILSTGNYVYVIFLFLNGSFFLWKLFIEFIQLPVSLGDKVYAMIEYAYGIVDGEHDLIVAESCEEGLLKIGIEPEVPPHHNKGIDAFMERDAHFMLFIGVFHKESAYFRVGPFAVIDPPEVFIKICGILNARFFC
jgi:hypothetical protein